MKNKTKQAVSIVRQLGDDKAKASAEIARLRDSLTGIVRYGKLCKGTDAERMTYLAELALGPRHPT